MRCFHLRKSLLILLLGLPLCVTASADIIITTSSTPPVLGPDEVPLQLTNDANAPTVFGTVKGIPFSFATPSILDSLYVHTDNSHPRIEAEDGSINILRIATKGLFSDFLADVYGVYDMDRDHVTIVVLASDGTHTQVLPMDVGASNSNFLSIVATDGELINSIALGTDSDPARFVALRDVYVSGAQVPEPGSLMLLIAGLITITVSRRKSA